jgi:hypothetical protein
LSRLYTNAIFLPRQAREKYRESSTQNKTAVFFSAGTTASAVGLGSQGLGCGAGWLIGSWIMREPTDMPSLLWLEAGMGLAVFAASLTFPVRRRKKRKKIKKIKKTVTFFGPLWARFLCVKMIILPRQARDKNRANLI